MRFTLLKTLLGLAVLATPVAAADVLSCDGYEANAANVMWSDPTRTFANGAIRLIALDTEEPVCCTHHLMVLHPQGDDPFQGCSLISGPNWTGLSLASATARYDAGRGLSITIPTRVYNGEGSDASHVTVTVNQATGQVIAE